MMRPPAVYSAINAVTADLAKAGLAKQNFNLQDDYFYRSIDDVINCLSPLLAMHRLCVLPRALERTSARHPTPHDKMLTHVTLKVAFDLISVDDGSRHTVKAYGEAIDDSDKATAKAMSAAYKSVMLQAFCVPVVGADDPDRGALVSRRAHDPQPVQGWEQWSRDVIEVVKACESEEAVSRVQDTHRSLLKAVQRERRELFQAIGEEFAARRTALSSGAIQGLSTNGVTDCKARPRKRARAKDREGA